MSACNLPPELRLEISSYLSWSELALWILTNREHEKCISPILYNWLTPFDYGTPPDQPDDRSNFTRRCRILNWAASKGLVGTIEKVLASEDIGERINYPILKNGRGTRLGSFGMTPMHQAAVHGHANVIDYLVQRGASVNATVAGRLRPIHFAKNEAVVRALIRQGSPLHPNGIFSISPLAHSISIGAEPSAVECFIELGCDIKAHSLVGISPLEATLRAGNLHVLKVLLNAGLDVTQATSMVGPAIYRAIELHGEKQMRVATLMVCLLHQHGAPVHGGKIIVNGPWNLHLLQSNLFLAVTFPRSRFLARVLLEAGAKANEQSWVRKRVRPIEIEPQRGQWNPERAWVGRRISYSVEPQTPIKKLILSTEGHSEANADDLIETIQVLARFGAKVNDRRGTGNFIRDLLMERPLSPGLVKMAAYVAGLPVRRDDREPRYTLLEGPIGPIYPFLFNPEWFVRSRYTTEVVTMGIFEKLLDFGADIHEPDARGNSPLILACTLPPAANGMKVIRALKARGVDINAGSDEGKNPLHMMLRGGSPLSLETANRFQAILTSPTGEMQTEICVNAPDRSGMTPLMTLAHMRLIGDGYPGRAETPLETRNRMMMMLIRNGVNVNAKYYPREGVTDIRVSWPGGTALHFACDAMDPEGVRLLLKYGAKADVNSVTDNGFTPLMVVMARGISRNDIVTMKRYLLEAGADPDIKNPEGKTAMDIWMDRRSGPVWLWLTVLDGVEARDRDRLEDDDREGTLQ